MVKEKHLRTIFSLFLSLVLFWVVAGFFASAGFTAGKANSVVIAQSTDATSLDPAFRVDTATGNVQKHIFDSLLIRKADMSISPGLAESVKRITDTKWLVKVRRGVLFTNGEPLNAAAVKLSIDAFSILNSKPLAKGGGPTSPTLRLWTTILSRSQPKV